MGLVSAHHNLNQDAQAIADVQKMPPATYEAALADPGFLQMLGSIYQQANQFEIAQGLLERSIKIQTAAATSPRSPSSCNWRPSTCSATTPRRPMRFIARSSRRIPIAPTHGRAWSPRCRPQPQH